MPTYTKKQQEKIIGDAIEANKIIDKLQNQVSEINVNITSLVKDRIAAHKAKNNKRKIDIIKNIKANKKLKEEKEEQIEKYNKAINLRKKMNKDLSEGYQFKF
tara:strand:- start:828 stop:1136 length:309 start_codon:yes stop_codon:yes gene_type:complete